METPDRVSKPKNKHEDMQYMYELVTPSDKHFKRLTELRDEFPALVFNNDGYEKLSKEIQEEYKEQIAEITAILKESLIDFVTFNNFVPRKDGTTSVRVQYKWDVRFTGVGYFDLRHWNPKEHGKY